MIASLDEIHRDALAEIATLDTEAALEDFRVRYLGRKGRLTVVSAGMREVAPADVHVVAAGKDEAVLKAAEELSTQLDRLGVAVIFDDRPKVSPGVKFKDAELIGVPTIVTVGRGLADGEIEVKDRATGERRNLAVDTAAEQIREIVTAS